MIDPGVPSASLDPGLTGVDARPVEGVDNGYLAGYRVRFDEAGPDARVRTSALLRYAQDVAWRHSEHLGFDRRWYTNRARWWVVRAVELDVLVPIPMGHTLRVSTAVIGHRRIWARRLAECRLADGTLAANIVTDWVILDERGRLVRIPEDFGLSFSNPELDGDILRVGLPSPPESAVARISSRVRPQDLDPMDHVNNAVYLEWVEEILAAAGLDAAVGALPRRLRLEYRASAAGQEEIEATCWTDGSTWFVRIAGGDGAALVEATGAVGGNTATTVAATQLSGDSPTG
jgi:acyl-ACP thioesterase